MTRHRLARCILPVLVACAVAVWSDPSPVAASGIPDDLQDVTAARPVAGTYTMLFQPTRSGKGVILDAYVTDAAGAPAQAGAATFQFCSLHGTPAPRANCDSGSGSWMRYGRSEIVPSPFPLAGHAPLVYGEAPPAG